MRKLFLKAPLYLKSLRHRILHSSGSESLTLRQDSQVQWAKQPNRTSKTEQLELERKDSGVKTGQPG
jgi:hypothetical protein